MSYDDQAIEHLGKQTGELVENAPFFMIVVERNETGGERSVVVSNINPKQIVGLLELTLNGLKEQFE